MFHSLPHITLDELPLRFTYPFHYEAHPLCKRASEELQSKLKSWHWDNKHQGKMFGVLIVKNKNGELGYLWAYSGNISDKLNKASFVPPIYDLLDPKSFFIEGEKKLTQINKQIFGLEHSRATIEAKNNCIIIEEKMKQALEAEKIKNKSAKADRKSKRELKKYELSADNFKILESQLINESQREKSSFKQLKNLWKKELEDARHHLELQQQKIKALKENRQSMSAALQQRLFDQYQLLNAKGEIKSLSDIFQDSIGKTPPAAAGDCAAPRLLQYAYKNEMQPLAMAEFWWGKSPLSIIRKEGNYYPACRGKCEPILGHMLQGLDVDDNPLKRAYDKSIEIVFEDADLLVVNKPEGMLSIPGKTKQTSIIEQLIKQRRDLKNLIIVHRLDMSTSGLLLIAKNETSYKSLQNQFLKRQVKKRYEALLDGNIEEDNGKIDLPLRVDLDNRPQQMVCHQYGKNALTIWKVIKRYDNKTRIEFFPVTGRTHQLRVHAAHRQGLNTPIVGDELYGTKSERLHLHAANIEFTHPTSGKKMKFSSSIPF